VINGLALKLSEALSRSTWPLRTYWPTGVCALADPYGRFPDPGEECAQKTPFVRPVCRQLQCWWLAIARNELCGSATQV